MENSRKINNLCFKPCAFLCSIIKSPTILLSCSEHESPLWSEYPDSLHYPPISHLVAMNLSDKQLWYHSIGFILLNNGSRAIHITFLLQYCVIHTLFDQQLLFAILLSLHYELNFIITTCIGKNSYMWSSVLFMVLGIHWNLETYCDP